MKNVSVVEVCVCVCVCVLCAHMPGSGLAMCGQQAI